MKRPLVSFIITAYNAEPYIRSCVQSCLYQDYEPLEVIITDDGSRDHTLDVLQESFGNNPRVLIVTHKHNLGKISGFNRSYMFASGEYIALIGADDTSYSHRISKQLAALTKNDVAMVSSDLDTIDERGNVLQHEMLRTVYGFRDSFKYSFDELVSMPCVYGNTLFFRKSVGDRIFPLSLQLTHEDWWLPAMLTYAGGGLYIPDVLIGYRQHTHNSSRLSQPNLEKFYYLATSCHVKLVMSYSL